MSEIKRIRKGKISIKPINLTEAGEEKEDVPINFYKLPKEAQYKAFKLLENYGLRDDWDDSDWKRIKVKQQFFGNSSLEPAYSICFQIKKDEYALYWKDLLCVGVNWDNERKKWREY